MSEAKLGQVKEFGVLVQAAQRQGVPLSQANEGDDTQKEQARLAFRQIADKILKKTAAARVQRLVGDDFFRKFCSCHGLSSPFVEFS